MIGNRKVNEIPLALDKVKTEESRQSSSAERNRKRWTARLYFSFIGGISSLLAGLLVSVSTVFGLIRATREISLAVSVLAVAAFSLLVCGAHAMDQIAELDLNEKLRKLEEEIKHERYSPKRSGTH